MSESNTDIEKTVLEDIGEVLYTKINYDLLHEMIEPIVKDIVENHISMNVDFEKYSLDLFKGRQSVRLYPETTVEEDDVDFKILNTVVLEVLVQIGLYVTKSKMVEIMSQKSSKWGWSNTSPTQREIG